MSWQHEQPFHQFLSLSVTEHRQLVYLVSIAELGHFLQLWVKYVCVTMEYCCSLKPLRSLKMGLFLISTISGIGSIVVFRHSSILSPEQLFILVCESLRLLLFKRWGLNIFCTECCLEEGLTSVSLGRSAVGSLLACFLSFILLFCNNVKSNNKI